jgi:hypothetical protein
VFAIIVLLLVAVLLGWSGHRDSQPHEPAEQPQLAIMPDSSFPREPLRATLNDSHDHQLRNELAEHARQNLSTLLERAGATAPVGLSALVDDGFSGEPLRPKQLERIFRDDTVLVRRGLIPSSPTSTASARPRVVTAPPVSSRSVSSAGSGELIRLLSTLRTILGPSDQWNATITVTDIQQDTSRVTTRMLVALGTRSSQHRAQIRTHWDCHWNRDDHRLRLASLRVKDYEEIVARYPNMDWLVEYTPSVLEHNPSYRDQLAFGLDHWLPRIERANQMRKSSANGLALGDANGDGLDDIYVCQPGGLPNRLYLQNLDGTATDVSMRSHTDWLDNTSSALFADLDNDGDQDLIVATQSGLLAMKNNGAAQFELFAVLPTSDAEHQSLTAADFDDDGDLDLYVCLGSTIVPVGQATRSDRSVPRPTTPGPPNHLFRNAFVPSGHWGFSDETRSSGLDTENQHHSLAASWEDFNPSAVSSDLDQRASSSIGVDVNNDGWQDLVNAGPLNHCLLNLGESTYFDISTLSNLDLPDDGRAIAATDWDQDGDVDLWIVNRSGPQLRFLSNEVPTNQHYVSLRLVGQQCNRDAIGARVELVLRGDDDQRRRQTLQAGNGCLSQSSKWLHFGLGRSPRLDRVDVYWPGGNLESFEGLSVDGHYQLTQGTGFARPITTGERTIELRRADASQIETSPAEALPAHTLIASQVAWPELPYTTSHGEAQQVRSSRPRPLLLSLTAQWLDDCRDQLVEFAARQGELQYVDLDLLVLSVDHLVARPEPSQLAFQGFAELEFPYSFGRATQELLSGLQRMDHQLFDSHDVLPIPCSVLISPDGRLAAVYKGPVTVDRLLADVAKLDLNESQRHLASLPFAGRWAPSPPIKSSLEND